MSTFTISLSPSTATVTSSVRMRSSSLRSARVVVGASQTRGRSEARDLIASRSAGASTAGACPANRWYPASSRPASASADSQPASSCRVTSLFSGSASWYWRRGAAGGGGAGGGVAAARAALPPELVQGGPLVLGVRSGGHRDLQGRRGHRVEDLPGDVVIERGAGNGLAAVAG